LISEKCPCRSEIQKERRECNVNYLLLIIGCVATAYVATTFRGLSFGTYIPYSIGVLVSTMFFLVANRDMPPIHYVVGVNAGITIASCIFVWMRGVPISPNALIGCVLLIVGTYLTMH
jgi:hypothetical protein